MNGGKLYEGRRDWQSNAQVTVCGEPLRHVVLHSPTGFEWGYGGSGPADLALSILADYFGECPTREDLMLGRCKAVGVHQEFKWWFIAGLDRDRRWMLHGLQIREWLGSLGNGCPAAR